MTQEPAESGARRRGTRGGRARAQRGGNGDGGILDDPRVAGRRPAKAAAEPPAPEAEAPPPPRRRRAAKAAADASPDAAAASEAEASPAPRRRRAAKAAAEPPSDAAATPEAEAPPAPRRRASRAAAEPTPDAAAASEAEASPAPRRRRASRAAAEPTPDAAAASDAEGLTGEVRALRSALEEQTRAIASLREEQERASRKLRLGVFVDVPNLIYGAERGEGGVEGVVHMGRLLDYLRAGRELIRATAYAPVSDDPGEPVEHQRFVAPFVPYDYRIVTKPLKRFADGSIKGNFDVEMALDMVTMAERLDVVALVSGDADFARAVELLQGRGVRVEVVAFGGSTSIEMRALADHYVEVGALMDRVGV